MYCSAPGAPGASGPILSDPARFRAFRTHLGRPRHQGKQKNDFGKKCFFSFEKMFFLKKMLQKKLTFGEKQIIKAYSMWAFGHVDMRTCGHAHMWRCRHAHMWTCGHVDMWTCAHAHMSTCRHVHMRTWRHSDMRTCGHADMRTCGHAEPGSTLDRPRSALGRPSSTPGRLKSAQIVYF